MQPTNNEIVFLEPAAQWNQALPLGNGFLGAMMHGLPHTEHLQINEDSLWSGGPRDRTNPSALQHLPRMRELLRAGRAFEAQQLALDAFSGVPENQRHFEHFADVLVSVGHGTAAPAIGRPGGATVPQAAGAPQDYSRRLDLDRAVCSVDYRVDVARAATADPVRYHRECFVSFPDRALVLRLTADRPAALSIKAKVRRLGALSPTAQPQPYTHFADRIAVVAGGPDAPGLVGVDLIRDDAVVGFCAGLRVHSTDGCCAVVGETIDIRDASQIVLVFAGTTAYRTAGGGVAMQAVTQHRLAAAAGRSYAQLLQRHIADYQALYQRVVVRLRPPATAVAAPPAAAVATGARLARLRANLATAAETPTPTDPGLAELYLNFGRYLLIAGSRPGSLPLTLQGIWNDQFLPPWDSKYTININTQMNYWPTEIGGLPELHEPLFDLLDRALVHGTATAAAMYGCAGACMHHNTDIWGDTSPQGLALSATYWPTGAVWFAKHYWDHYLFDPTQRNLDRAYRFLQPAARFMLDFLIENEQGELVTSPSSSPENSYFDAEGRAVALCEGPAMDAQMTAYLFDVVQQAESALGIVDGVASACAAAGRKLHGYKLAADGRLLEWNHEVQEVEPGHRHLSHLWGLFPGECLDPVRDAAIVAACRSSLQHRLANGGGKTGWSRAWVINLCAQLADGDAALAHFDHLLAQSTYPNLLDVHPPFQIDGNFGGAAGILQMLIQSAWIPGSPATITLLPALPSAWPTGEFRGLRARGGIVVDLQWERGVPTGCRLSSTRDQQVVLRCGGQTNAVRRLVELPAGVPVDVTVDGL